MSSSICAKSRLDSERAFETLPPSLTREYLQHHRCCPEGLTPSGRLLVLATPDSSADEALGDLSIAYQREVELVSTTPFQLERAIERLCGPAMDSGADEQAGVEQEEQQSEGDVRDLASQPPVIRFVNVLIRDAHERGASDIHLDGNESGVHVRFRIDGVLVPAPEPPAQHNQAIVSRLKLLADLDIAERRKPQDGRIRVRLESRELDLRLSTVPTLSGESVVLRLLDQGARPVTLSELGMPPAMLTPFERYCERSHGLILVTGPTGSGKTTTLYAALQRRIGGDEKIVTIEDPIEYRLAGVTQVPVHRQAGVSFGTALRSILRQDPDVIMIGEMRDAETAQLAVQAALTGHLVLATLHTNDAASAIPRLLDLGVPAYLVSACLETVVAQRLARRICDACRSLAKVPRGRNANQAPSGDRCDACRGTGFRGRVALFEMLQVNDPVRSAINNNASHAEILRAAAENGFASLQEDAEAKVRQGLTTLEEARRVIE